MISISRLLLRVDNTKIIDMNKTIKASLTVICLSIGLTSCLTSNNNQDGYEVTLSADELKYVPSTPNQIDDKEYMNQINSLIEEIAASVYDETDFINIIKAIAWTESRWEHYFERDNKYYVFLGDEGHSYGMMQIYDSYHGVHPVLQDNIEYGATFAFTKYQTAKTDTCLTGTNAGSSLIAIARRTYAQYNGGNAAVCRNNDQRDNNLEDALSALVWNNYL